MKKLNFLALATAMAAVLFAFSACGDPANDTENPGGDNTGEWGGNGDDVRLVDKITITEDGYSYGHQLSYDDQNRITKIESFDNDYKDGEYETRTYSYGAKTLTVNQDTNRYEDEHLGEGQEPYFLKSIYNYVFNLDSEGRVISIASSSIKYWTNEVFTNGYSLPDTDYSYEDGYLKKISHNRSDNSSDGDFTERYSSDYVWTGGNLTKKEENTTIDFVEDAREDEVYYSSETDCTYGTLDNPVNVSLDLNALLTFDGELLYAEAMGFLGKSSAKLVSSRSSSYNGGEPSVTEYDWELDSNGYVTKMTSTEEDGYTYTMTVTYKN